MSDIKRVFGIVTAVFVLLLAVPFVSAAADDPGTGASEWTYLDQIDDDGKRIYEAASKTFNDPGNAGMTFSASGLNMVMVKTGDRSAEAMMDAVNASVRSALTASVLDDPLAYWGWSTVEGTGFTVDPGCVKEFSDAGVTYLRVSSIDVTVNPVAGGSDLSELKSRAAEVRATVDGFTSEGKDRAGILSDIGGYLKDNLKMEDGTKNVLVRTVYGAMGSSDRITSSDGYAQAFKLLCDKYGIPCIIAVGHAVGSGSEPWMWNLAEPEDGRWFAYDSAMNSRHDTGSYSMCGYATVCSDGYAFSASHQADPGRMASGLADAEYPALQDKLPDPVPGFFDKYGAQLVCFAIGGVIIISLFDMARRMRK